MKKKKSTASCLAVNSSVFLAIGTTFKLALSHDDFGVFALEGTLIVLQISFSKSVHRFVNHWARNLKEGSTTFATVT